MAIVTWSSLRKQGEKDHWVRRYVRGGSAQKLDWLVVEEITQLDMALWADLACVGLNADKMCFTVPPNGVAKLDFGAHFQAPGLPNQTAGTVDVYGLQILDANTAVLQAPCAVQWVVDVVCLGHVHHEVGGRAEP